MREEAGDSVVDLPSASRVTHKLIGKRQKLQLIQVNILAPIVGLDPGNDNGLECGYTADNRHCVGHRTRSNRDEVGELSVAVHVLRPHFELVVLAA